MLHSFLLAASLAPVREVAITIDDLPVANAIAGKQAETTRQLMASFARNHVKATGFVIGEQVRDPALLRAWL